MADTTMRRFLMRDLAILLLSLPCSFFASTEASLVLPVAIDAGIVAFSGRMVHEMAHRLGARCTGAIITPARSMLSPFPFNFDPKSNSRRQFLGTSRESAR